MQENGHGQTKSGQSPEGTEWQAGSRSGQAEWSGRRVQSPDRQGSQLGGLAKQIEGKSMLVDLTNKTNWQQTSREHRNKYPGTNEKNR
jgi:hypothetical protein